MSLSPNNKRKQGPGKIPTSKTLQEEGAKNDHHDHQCKIRRTSSSFSTNLPDDCLNLIFKYLETRDDRNSFGLTRRDWLRVRDNNQESLWYKKSYRPEDVKYPKISPERLAIITCKLLIRFQHLKILNLGRLPRITDVDTLKSHSFGSDVQELWLDNHDDYSPKYSYSDIQLSMIFSWFPRLTCISLRSSGISDKGLETLAKCCSSLKTVNLEKCCSITDSGLSCLLQNCRELRSLNISCCSSITGIGFLGCAHSLTRLAASEIKLTLEVINAIVSGGELEWLDLDTPNELAEVGKGCIINTEAILTISKGCPLLKILSLSNCEEVELEGYEAIGMKCKELQQLYMMGCQKLCDIGLQAICDGCKKLIEFYIDAEKNSCSSSILEHYFDGKKPEVILWS